MASVLRLPLPSPRKKPLRVRANESISSAPNAWKSLQIFQDEHEDFLEITFHRSLRVPEKERPQTKTLPPGLGTFPIYNTDQFCHELPDGVAKQGGAFVPIYQREALFVSFSTARPFAIKIFSNNTNIITGRPKPVVVDKSHHPAGHWLPPKKWIGSFQDYVVPPRQLWVDGVATWNGVRQFAGYHAPSISSANSPISTSGVDRMGLRSPSTSPTPYPPALKAKAGFEIQDPGKGKGKEKEEYGEEIEMQVQKIQFEIIPLRKKDMWIYLVFVPDRLVSKLRIEVWWKESVVQVVREIILAWGDDSKILMVSCYGKQVGSFDCFADLDLAEGDTLYVYIDQLFSPKVPGSANCYSGGLSRQNIPKDLFQPEDWDSENRLQFTVQLVPVPLFCSSLQLPPPKSSVNKALYEKYGLKWLEWYQEGDGSTGDEIDELSGEEIELKLSTIEETGEYDGGMEAGADDNSGEGTSKKSFHKSRSVNDFLKEVLMEEMLKKATEAENSRLIIDDDMSAVD